MKRSLLLPAGYIASIGMLALSGVLILQHIQALRATRESALPLAADLVPLEQRVSVLKQQMDLEAVQDQLRSSSNQEKFDVYVLPAGSDLTRTLGLLGGAEAFLKQQGSLSSISSITVGDRQQVPTTQKPDGNGALESQVLSFTLTGKPEGIHTFLSLLDLTGTLTVGDALTPAEREQLFTVTEKQDYAGIVPLEQFFAVDLPDYARNPRVYDDRLTQALSSEEFLSRFHDIVHGSRLQEAVEVLGGPLGDVLTSQKLWPTQFLGVDQVTVKDVEGGLQQAEVKAKAYSRQE